VRLLVVGGSGFLGGYVLAAAAAHGHQVTALARSPEAAAKAVVHGATPLAGDLGQAGGLDAAFTRAGCETLVCLASLGTGLGPAIVAAAEEAGIRRAVFVSTTSVTTTLDPPSKQIRLAAEQQVRGSGLDWTILRPTMIYGAPGDRNLSRLLLLLRRAPVLPVPAVGGRLHQPVHVADAAGAVIAAVERPGTAGHRYDVAGPAPLPFAELLRTCAAAAGSATRFVPVPLPPLIAAARAYQLLSRHPRIKAEQVRRLGEDKAFVIDEAASDLGYRPRPFRDGIEAEARALGLAS
jgi:uncharacterized protein YbjT (DUF2867 family)